MSDRWMNTMLDRIQAVSNDEQPMNWKRADWSKIIDEAYIRGFSDGEKVASNVRITAEQGRRFKVKRDELDFPSFNKLCHKLQVRLDAESIDFIGFDVHAYKMDGQKFQNIKGIKQKEEVCQVESTPFM